MIPAIATSAAAADSRIVVSSMASRPSPASRIIASPSVIRSARTTGATTEKGAPLTLRTMNARTNSPTFPGVIIIRKLMP